MEGQLVESASTPARSQGESVHGRGGLGFRAKRVKLLVDPWRFTSEISRPTCTKKRWNPLGLVRNIPAVLVSGRSNLGCRRARRR